MSTIITIIKPARESRFFFLLYLIPVYHTIQSSNQPTSRSVSQPIHSVVYSIVGIDGNIRSKKSSSGEYMKNKFATRSPAQYETLRRSARMCSLLLNTRLFKSSVGSRVFVTVLADTKILTCSRITSWRNGLLLVTGRPEPVWLLSIRLHTAKQHKTARWSRSAFVDVGEHGESCRVVQHDLSELAGRGLHRQTGRCSEERSRKI